MKKILIVAMSLLLALSLCACTGETGATNTPGAATQSPSTEPTTQPTTEITPPVKTDCDVPNPFNDTTYKISIAEDFSDAANWTIFAGVPGSVVENDDTQFVLSEGQMEVLPEADAAIWAGLVSPKFDGAAANSVGFGFYVKNDTGEEYTFTASLTTSENGDMNNGGAFCVGSNKQYILVDMNGSQTVYTAVEKKHPYADQLAHSDIVLPVDFEGYVLTNFDQMQTYYGLDVPTNETVFTGFGWSMISPSNGESVFIDNIFFYGPDVTENATDIIINR